MEVEWYRDFIDLERDMLFNLVAAANYLDIKPLLAFCCLAVSVSIMGKSEEEMRNIFNIKDPQLEIDWLQQSEQPN